MSIVVLMRLQPDERSRTEHKASEAEDQSGGYEE